MYRLHDRGFAGFAARREDAEMTHLRRARVAALIIVAVLAVAGGFAARSFEGGSAHSKAALQKALATPGQVGEAGEASLTAVERYWQTRLTYPTGRFNQNWVNAAARQLKRMKAGVPKGFYRPWRGRPGFASGPAKTQAAAALAAARPLGPQPQASSGCQPPCFTFGLVSGRVSAIAFDPTQTNVAYIAQDGGGIWKTTNCCSPATSWQVTTDKIAGGTTAVDDVTVDPNNHNTVYAATGDISFGSFAFGSAGILKSTDAGATWQALATGTFAPVYPPSTGGTYPQYQAVTKIRVDPNDSNKLVAGTKTGVFFSYDAGVHWSGACKTNNFSSQRQDITDLILRDNGSTTTVFAAVGARGFATTVQQNLGKNGANGVYVLNSMPASGCPAVASWTALTSGWPAGTAGGVACNPPIGDMTTTCAPNA